jgi:hypothetical protein
MDAAEIITGRDVQHDPSGVGHAWRTIPADDIPASIREEIACWILEADNPSPGTEYVATGGQHYRLPPA